MYGHPRVSARCNATDVARISRTRQSVQGPYEESQVDIQTANAPSSANYAVVSSRFPLA